MKKISRIAFALCLAMLLFSGCSAETLAPSSPPTLSPENTSDVSNSPVVSNDLVSSKPAEAASYEEMPFGGYVYYIDVGSDSRFNLFRKNSKGGDTTEYLYYTESDIYSLGDYRYINVSISDASLYPDWKKHWLTCKVDKDDRVQKFIGGDAVLIQQGDSLYYSKYGEGCIFKSGLDCGDPARVKVTPSGDKNPFDVLSKTEKGRLTEITDLYSIKDGSIKIGYDIIDEQRQCLFADCYNISLKGYKVKEAYLEKRYGNKIYKNAWLYYIDLKKPIKSHDSDEPLYYIHRMNRDGSGDKNLKILCFSFDFAGQYLYTDTNITYGDFGHWDTYQYNLDGKEKKKIKYGDMNRFSKEDKLYFSLFDESAFYSATTACTKVEKHTVNIPDDKTIHKKLGYNYECVFITVTDDKEGWVYFQFKVTDTGPFTYYKGNYRMNLESRTVEKVGDGKYYSYEWD